MKKLFLILAAALSLACITAVAGCGATIDGWPSGTLGQMIPQAKGSKVKEIRIEEEDHLAFEIEISKEDYKTYVEDLKSAGFENEQDSSSSRYEAYNDDGYKVEIWFLDSYSSISVDAPEQLSEMSWPSSPLAQLLPTPEFTKGRIDKDKSDRFEITINMTKEKYQKYVDSLMSAGFNVDYDRDEDDFKGYNLLGNKVECDYTKYNTVEIKLKADSDSDSEKKETTASATTAASATGLREFADEYEAFMDKYIAFMKNYDATDLSKLSEYTELLKQYQELTSKAIGIDTTKYDLSDVTYFTETIARADKKLIDAGIF